jgi:outer membrane receptor protein involved in Fe transport
MPAPHRLALRGALALVLFGSPALRAADPQSIDELFALSLEDLQQVTVETAARRELSPKDAPGSVSVFTREEILHLGVRTLDELLNFVPGMRTYTYVGSDSSGKSVVESRGIYNPNGYMVLLLIDGQRINAQYTGNFTGANRWISLTPFEKVEVVRGPASALYGGNALLAVINLVSERETARNCASAETGAFAHRRYGVQTGSGRADDWHWRLWAEWQQDDGEDYPDAFDPLRLDSDGTRDPREGRDLQLNAGNGALSLLVRHHWRESEDFYLLGRMADGINVSETEQNNARLSWQSSLGSAEINLAAWYLEARWEGLTRLAPQGVPPFFFADFIAGPALEHNEYGVNADLVQPFGDSDVLNYGLSWEIGRIPQSASQANYNTRPPYNYYGEILLQDDDAHRLVSDEDRHVAAGYLQWDHAFDPAFRSVLGLRYDAYDPGEAKLSPRAALIYSLNPAHTLKAQYSESFIPPSQADQFIRPSPILVPPAKLEPISGKSTEFAWVYESRGLAAGATLYWQIIDRLIGRVPVGGGRVTIANSGEVSSSGIEAELSWQAAANWLLRLNGSHVFDRNTEGAPPDFPDSEYFAVQDLVSAISHWRISDRLQFDLQGQWGSAIAALPGNDGFTLWHAHLRYALSSRWELYGGVRNLGDEQSYSAEPGAGLGVDDEGNIVRDLPQRGREWQLGLRWTLE